MAWVVAKKVTTPAKWAVDGKEHHRTQYELGRMVIGGIMFVQNWGRRKDAKKYKTKREAQRRARECGEGAYVVEIKERRKK